MYTHNWLILLNIVQKICSWWANWLGYSSAARGELSLGSAEAVCVGGRCIAKKELSKSQMERGIERWTMDCSCGDRMLACDKCGVWRHTICSTFMIHSLFQSITSTSIILACKCRGDTVAHHVQIYECLKRKIQMLKYEINLQKQVQTSLC